MEWKSTAKTKSKKKKTKIVAILKRKKKMERKEQNKREKEQKKKERDENKIERKKKIWEEKKIKKSVDLITYCSAKLNLIDKKKVIKKTNAERERWARSPIHSEYEREGESRCWFFTENGR